jgi:hypothetical protein
MLTAFVRKSALSTVALSLASFVFASSVLSVRMEAQSTCVNCAPGTTFFQPGNLVVLVEGCGVNGGTCTSIPSGNGTGGTGTPAGTNPGTSTTGGYGDNQGAPITLFQYAPTDTTSVQYVNSIVLPQTASGANLPIAGEYGSSSEGSLSLSGQGQYLVFGAYGINAQVFDTAPATYGAAPSLALAQSGSLTNQSTYTPVARTIVMVDPNGNVNSSTPIYNIFNTNNPRSVYTLDGVNAWISGQGSSPDLTGGVFYTPLGAVNNTPTPITGADTSANASNQDTRELKVYNGTLYVSVDSKEGSNNARSFLGTLGNPPSTTLYQPMGPAGGGAGPTQIPQATVAGKAISNAGKVQLTAATANNVNVSTVAAAKTVNLSPSGFFFASPTVLYIADTGNGKQTSGDTTLGAGGLQKWVLVNGSWVFEYTISAGLNLVANTSAAGTTGLYALTGVVNGANVYLYATNYTINDMDQRYLFGFTDVLASTTQPTGAAATFTTLATAPADSNFKGVSFVPTYPTGSATLTTVPSGLTITTAGAGCAPGTYVTPVTLVWTPGSSCTLTTAASQKNGNTALAFQNWQDNKTTATETVVAQSSPTTYTATFVVPGVASVTTSAASIVLSTASTPLTASVAFSGPTSPASSAITFTVNGSSTGVGATTCTGTSSPITCTAPYNSTNLAVGKYPIVATASAAASMTGSAITGTNTLTVSAATDFSFTVPSGGTPSLTLSSGGTAAFAFAVVASQGSFPGPVSFTVSGLPNGVTGAFSPSTLAANAGTQNVTLTLTASSTAAAVSTAHTQIAYGSIAFLATLLLPLGFRRRLRLNLMRTLTLALFLVGSVATMTGLAGCSNHAAATTPGSVSSNATVTATSGAVVHAVTLTVTVNH